MKIPAVQNSLMEIERESERESLSALKREKWGEALSEEGNSGSKRRENMWRNGYEGFRGERRVKGRHSALLNGP
jgi:hypothetical protein